jgi:hypothetical protein
VALGALGLEDLGANGSGTLRCFSERCHFYVCFEK